MFVSESFFLIFFANYCEEEIVLLDKCGQEHRGNHFIGICT